MSQVSRWHFPLLSIATLALALAAPTAAPAQNPCMGAGDTPSAQCQEWQKQQKLTLTCSQHPQKPECKDWLEKQSQAGRTKPVRTTQTATGSKNPSGADTKGLKRGKGSGTDDKGIIIVHGKSKGGKASGTDEKGAIYMSPSKGGTAEKGIIIDNGKPGAAEKGIILQSPGGVGTRGIILQNRGK